VRLSEAWEKEKPGDLSSRDQEQRHNCKMNRARLPQDGGSDEN